MSDECACSACKHVPDCEVYTAPYETVGTCTCSELRCKATVDSTTTPSLVR